MRTSSLADAMTYLALINDLVFLYALIGCLLHHVINKTIVKGRLPHCRLPHSTLSILY